MPTFVIQTTDSYIIPERIKQLTPKQWEMILTFISNFIEERDKQRSVSSINEEAKQQLKELQDKNAELIKERDELKQQFDDFQTEFKKALYEKMEKRLETIQQEKKEIVEMAQQENKKTYDQFVNLLERAKRQCDQLMIIIDTQNKVIEDMKEKLAKQSTEQPDPSTSSPGSSPIKKKKSNTIDKKIKSTNKSVEPFPTEYEEQILLIFSFITHRLLTDQSVNTNDILEYFSIDQQVLDTLGEFDDLLNAARQHYLQELITDDIVGKYQAYIDTHGSEPTRVTADKNKIFTQTQLRKLSKVVKSSTPYQDFINYCNERAIELGLTKPKSPEPEPPAPSEQKKSTVISRKFPAKPAPESAPADPAA